MDTADKCECPMCRLRRYEEGPLADQLPGLKDTSSLRDTNPKTQYGHAKPPLGLVPGSALVHVAEALRDGSDKYGAANWRQDAVTSQTYFDAALRHLYQWQDGEDFDPVSKVHHLAHAACNLMILLDARESGTLIDSRPTPTRTADLIRALTRNTTGGLVDG